MNAPTPAYTYTAWLVPSTRDPDGVVDGDTMHCRVDLGCNVMLDMTIRLYGINAPEMSTPEGKAAKEWVQAWFKSNCPEGKFILETIKDKTEKYGRYLGIVIPASGADILNEQMVRAGHAVIYLP